MKHFSYSPKGVCSVKMDFDIDEDNKIHNLVVIGGCNGNLKGIASLIEGEDKDKIIKRLKGIKCGFRDTSCPDQLSKALENVK